jgi:hypothetical protein
VSHLSPWRSYPIGSSFSSFSILPFSILHCPWRCDNPYSSRPSGFWKGLEAKKREEEREGGRRENWRGEADEDEAGGGEISHGGGAVVKH